jgi:CelD/BcsL family acetyltransferase involved in cellulose biosynthesis
MLKKQMNAVHTLPLMPVVEPITIVTTRSSDWHEAERGWVELTNESPYASFFLCADWIGTWIDTYRPCLDIEILRFFHGRQIVGACLLVWRRQRRGSEWIRRAYLNASGEDDCEEVGAEFNDLLCLRGWETAVASALRRHLDSRGWDEFVMNGCSRTEASAALQQAFLSHEQHATTFPSYYVDLNALRASGKPFEMSLSHKVRYNIRQSIKRCQESDQLRLTRAQSIEQAQAMLAELAMLHRDRWAAKGRPGAFASLRFKLFYHTMVVKYFDRGEIDILCVSAGDETIGILYNYVLKSKAFFYQYGFKFSNNKKLNPGLITLQVALQSYLESALPEFDLMAGDVLYKRSLAEQRRDLDWCTMRRQSWRNSLLDGLRDFRTRLSALVDRGGTEERTR